MDGINMLKLADFSRKVLVVGDLILNIDITGSCTKIAAEAPLPVFYESETNFKVAGAANATRNLKALGVKSDIVAIVNKEDERILSTFEKEGIRSDHLIQIEGCIPETNTRYFDGGLQVFASRNLSVYEDLVGAEDAVLKKCEELMSTNNYSAVLLIGGGENDESTKLFQSVIDLATYNNTPTVLSSYSACVSNSNVGSFKGADIVVADKRTITGISHAEDIDGNEMEEVYKHMCSKLQIKKALFTLSENGYFCFETSNNRLHAVQPFAMPGNHLIGCMTKVKDAVPAAICFGVSCQIPLQQTCAIVSSCCRSIIREGNKEVVNITDVLDNKVIRTKEELENFTALLPKDKKIVATTGCFDLIHAIHVENLRLAKELGDILVIMLNSDQSVRGLKGPSRPVYSLEDRVALLTAVKHVDFIVVFDESVPCKQIEILNPDVLVKGPDYTVAQVMKNNPFLKQCKIVSPYTRMSTTGTIATIERLSKC